MAELETEFAAHIGVSAIDTGTGDTVQFRPDQRFGYASTLKALVAAQFLREVPVAAREEVVAWSADDVAAAGYSPVTSKSMQTGLTLAQLAEAAVRESDNTALNVLLERIGGPAGFDATLEDLGDTTTEVVNLEPALNAIEPGSTDDTTTAAALSANLSTYLRDGILQPDDRATWMEWMTGNSTGDALIRAAAPAGWVVADKSGGAGGIRNDIAIVTPPGGDPILLTILTAKIDPAADYEDALVEQVADTVFRAFAGDG